MEILSKSNGVPVLIVIGPVLSHNHSHAVTMMWWHLFHSHSVNSAMAVQSLLLAAPNLSSQCWRAWLLVLSLLFLCFRSHRATFLMASSVMSRSTKLWVLVVVAFGVLASGCLDSKALMHVVSIDLVCHPISFWKLQHLSSWPEVDCNRISASAVQNNLVIPTL
jgi:hypothetical protein